MAKGIAVSQIILLVLGILVLAVVAYLLYSNFVTTGGTLTAEQCRAAATRACTACSIANFGSVSNCPADKYLTSDSDKECAAQGQIAGTSATRDGEGTVSKASGSITCSQYVGSPASGSGGDGNNDDDGIKEEDTSDNLDETITEPRN